MIYIQLPKNLEQFLKDSSSFNNSIILVTTKNDIIYNSYSEDYNIKLPENLIKEINYMYESNEVVKVYNDYKVKIIEDSYLNIKNQVIMLILDKNILVGSLILLSNSSNYEVANFSFSSTILNTLKTMLKFD